MGADEMEELTEFEFHGRILKLKQPLKLHRSEYTSFDGSNMVLLEAPDLYGNEPVIGRGENDHEAMEKLKKEFSVMYENALGVVELIEQ